MQIYMRLMACLHEAIASCKHRVTEYDCRTGVQSCVTCYSCQAICKSAYRKQQCTEAGLSRFLSDELTAAEASDTTVLGLPDLTTAFDCVSHYMHSSTTGAHLY